MNSCEHGNKPSDSTKMWELVLLSEQLPASKGELCSTQTDRECKPERTRNFVSL